MSFDYQPTLSGELITLAPLRSEHFHDLFLVASDPYSDRYKEDVFQTFFDDALASGGALIVRDRSDEKIIGSSRYHGYDGKVSEVEIGWTFLARSHWGGVYNGEMKKLMLDHAFQFVDTVVLLIGPENVRSKRAAEKIGAVRTGSSPNALGIFSDVYAIEATSWKERTSE